jgi:hypothetical protein
MHKVIVSVSHTPGQTDENGLLICTLFLRHVVLFDPESDRGARKVERRVGVHEGAIEAVMVLAC